MAWPKFLSFNQSRRTWGMLVLGIWLLITGLQKFGVLSFADLDKILAGLAVAAGALIILDK